MGKASAFHFHFSQLVSKGNKTCPQQCPFLIDPVSQERLLYMPDLAGGGAVRQLRSCLSIKKNTNCQILIEAAKILLVAFLLFYPCRIERHLTWSTYVQFFKTSFD